MGNPCVSHSITEAQIDDNYELLCRLWSTLVGAEEGGLSTPIARSTQRVKIETCRYGLNRIPVEERLCESCQVVEDKFHVMMVCPLFNDIRSQFILQLNEVEQSFNDYTKEEQFIYVMSNPACYKRISKAMYFILSKKHQMFYR